MADQIYGVVHPSHYNREGAIECIDEMELIFGPEETAIFCKLNAWKYRYRAGQKEGESGLKDLQKSDYYIGKFKKLKNRGYGLVTSHPQGSISIDPNFGITVPNLDAVPV